MSADRGAATVDFESAWSRLVPSTRSHSVLASGSAGLVRHAAHRTRPRGARYDRAVSLLLLVDLDGVVYRGAEPVPGVAAVLAARAARGRRRRLRHQQLDALPRRLRHPPRRHGRPGHARDRRLVGARDRPVPRTTTSRRSAACSSLGAGGLERELRDVGLEVVTAGHAATRMHQEGIDGWTAAGAPDAVVVRSRPEPDLPAPGGGLRLHPCRRAVHRHQPRSGLPDGTRPAARGGEHRRRDRGLHGRRPARRSASPARTCSSSPPRPSVGTSATP